MHRGMIVGFAFVNLALVSPRAFAQGAEVTAHVVVHDKVATAHHKGNLSPGDVVAWLTPLQPDGRPASAGHSGPFRLVQKDKMFTPHLLVVPTGSSVEFPNQDPFFHNVFSLFNGKRFDLGLYESGKSRAVRFDREGASYIFCNIHPEMGAIVLALSTPYYAVSGADGALTIHNVPPGSYHLHLWSEAAELANPADAGRIVQVAQGPAHLGDINLTAIANPMAHHTNKFGEEYHPTHDNPY
ncbi:MAG TPA: hypothetical protein VGN01_00905 [Acidobacteriaceae bacterium]